MSLIIIDGFDTYAAASDILRRWGTQYNTDIFLVAGRYGGQAMRIASAGVVYNVMQIAGIQTVVVGFAIKFNAFQGAGDLPCSFLHLMYGGTSNSYNQVGLGVDADYKLEVFTGDNFQEHGGTTLAHGTTVLSSGTWYYLEMKVYVHPSAGTVDVKINGSSEIALTGQNTQPRAAALIDYIGLVSGLAGDTLFDDFYLDGSTFHGPRRIETLTASADTAQKDFTASSGADNYAMVDEALGDGDTSYVLSAAVLDKDLYDLADLSEDPAAIDAVQLCVTARETDAGQYNLKSLLKSGATTYDGAAGSLTTSYIDVLEIWQTDPNGSAAWTKDAIDALQAGQEVTA